MEAKQLLDPLARETADYASTSGGEGDNKPNEPQMSFRIRMIKTCTMASLYVGLGFNSGVQGPSLLDMAGLFTDGNVEELSRAISMKAAGVLFGSFLGAFLADRFRKRADLFLFVIAITNGLSCAATPWMPNVALVGLLLFIQGLNHGTFNVACCAINIAIWGKRAAAPIHCLHMCYTVGYTLAQPVTGCFAVGISTDSNSTEKSPAMYQAFSSAAGHLADLGSYEDIHFIGENTTANGTQIYIPYGIFGAYQVLLSFAFLVFVCMGLTYTSATITSRKSFREMLNPSSCTGGRGCYGVYMLCSLLFIYICIVFREALIGMFLCTAGIYLFEMSPFKASLLGMAYNLGILLGRLLGMIFALCVRIQVMVPIELFSVLFFLGMLSIFGFKAEVWFWLLVCTGAVFMGPNYPSVMAWADRYIESTGFVVAVIDTGIGTGAFIATFVGGVVLQRLNPEWLFHLCTISAAVLLMLYLPLQAVANKHGDRHAEIIKVDYEPESDDEEIYSPTGGIYSPTGENYSPTENTDDTDRLV